MSVSTLRHASDTRSLQPVRYGAYVCLRAPADARPRLAAAAERLDALVRRLDLDNEFHVTAGDPPRSFALLRRIDATGADIDDPGILNADVVVHVAAAAREPVAQLCAEVAAMLGPSVAPRVVGGVVRPMLYTGTLMHNFAYAERVVQQPGQVMPHAFLLPMSKTPAWFAKNWMERHTYILPRYSDAGAMVHEGHALASAAGVSCLLRRTYKYETEPAPRDAYDFVTYFECADEDVETFHAVCAALRDIDRNPEWAFVREGPLWHGRRVASWSELFD